MTAPAIPTREEQNRSIDIRHRSDGWSRRDLDLLCELWASGLALAAIGARLGRTPEAVRSRVRRLSLAPRRRRHDVEPVAGSRRPCLACRTAFPSQGPHNRLCDRCRGRSGDFRVAL